jgi:hypothetical protein
MTSRDFCVGGLICGFLGLVGLACSAEGSTLPPASGSGGGTAAATGGGNAMGGGTGVGGGVPMTGGTSAVGTGGILQPTGGTTGTTGGTTGTTGGTTGNTGGTTSTTGDGASGLIPADGGNYVKDWDVSGVIGAWYTYQDEAGSTITPHMADPTGNGPFGNDGQFCFSGTAVGHMDSAYDTNWGAGVGMDLCGFPEDLTWLPTDLQGVATSEQKFSAVDCPTLLSGITSITFTVTGSVGPDMRLGVKMADNETDVSPFYQITSAGTYTVSPSEMTVPSDWDVPNPGATGGPAVYALQWQVASAADDYTFDFCITAVSVN